MDSTPPAATPPPILRLPPELLFEIISLAVPSILDKNIPLGLDDSPFHAVRSTCRTFRHVVDQLPFWNEDDFDISIIERFVPFEFMADLADMEVWPSRSTEVLLADPHLRQCLSQKTGWYIASPPGFDAISQNVPNFGQSVRYLDFNSLGEENDWVPVTNVLRNLCPTLTVLKVLSSSHIHFDTLPLTLRELEILGPERLECHCTNDLPNLEKFDYHFQLVGEHREPVDPVNLEWLLPFNSRATLEQLDICCGPQTMDKISLLYQFDHMTRLGLHGCNADMFRFLLEAHLRLQEFNSMPGDTYIDPDTPYDIAYVRAFLDFLTSPVLRDVKVLGLIFTRVHQRYMTPEHERITFECVIREITRLHALEILSLEYPLQVDWFPYFQEAHQLKSVWWLYPYSQRFANDNPERPTSEDHERALRQVLGDDVDVHIDCDYSPPRVESESHDESGDEDEPTGDPNLMEPLWLDDEDYAEMMAEYDSDDSDTHGGFF
jgi:hypothetical protein